MRQLKKDNIKLGIVGMGCMGSGLLYQSLLTPGVECVAVCDIDVQKCTRALTRFQIQYEVVTSPIEMADAISRGVLAVVEDGQMVSRCEMIDVFLEASSAIKAGIENAIIALENRKHLILINSEIDLTFGPILSTIAREKGVVFTSCDGDQYGVLKHLINDIQFWGFKLVMAGNIKGYLDRYVNPDTIIPEADKRNLDYRMCTAYTDGTKLNIEMAILANACNLITRTPGMSGPMAANLKEVFQLFNFDLMWDDHRPFVDYILGAEPGGGVFVVGFCEDSYQREMLSYYKMGDGPYYLFYRPYHLCHIEAMSTIIKAAVDCSSFLSPDYGLRTNVFAYAKKNLKSGEHLDGIGGYSCYGKIENLTNNNSDSGIPICLTDEVVLKRDIEKDHKITLSDAVYNLDRIDFKLYAESLKQPVRKQS